MATTLLLTALISAAVFTVVFIARRNDHDSVLIGFDILGAATAVFIAFIILFVLMGVAMSGATEEEATELSREEVVSITMPQRSSEDIVVVMSDGEERELPYVSTRFSFAGEPGSPVFLTRERRYNLVAGWYELRWKLELPAGLEV